VWEGREANTFLISAAFVAFKAELRGGFFPVALGSETEGRELELGVCTYAVPRK
jgi:hypothetical protein